MTLLPRWAVLPMWPTVLVNPEVIRPRPSKGPMAAANNQGQSREMMQSVLRVFHTHLKNCMVFFVFSVTFGFKSSKIHCWPTAEARLVNEPFTK